MDAPPPDNASLDPPIATDMRVEEDEASADGEDDGEDAKLLYINRTKRAPKRVQKPSPQKRTITIREIDEDKFDQGYDSDGYIGPNWSAVRREGPQLFDDDDDDDDDNKLREERVCGVMNTTAATKNYSLLTVEITS